MNHDNSEHLVTVQSSVGPLVFIQTARKNRPKGLRKPYEYVLTNKQITSLYQALRTYLNHLDDTPAYQHAGADKKGLSKGIKLDIFILSYAPDHRSPGEGVTEQQWDTACGHVQGLLFDALGPDAKMYIDDYSTERKFQARFEAYIHYKELL